MSNLLTDVSLRTKDIRPVSGRSDRMEQDVPGSDLRLTPPHWMREAFCQQ